MEEAYRIGISIAMASNAAGVLGAIGRDLLGVTNAAKELESTLASVKLAAVGTVTALAGGAALTGMWKMVKAAEELNRQLERTKLLGGDYEASVPELRARAFEVNRLVPQSTPSGNVKMGRELMAQVGVANAMALMPEFAKLQWLMEQSGQNPEGASLAAIKTMDLRGQIWKTDAAGNPLMDASGHHIMDMDKVRGELNAMFRGMVASGGLLSAQNFMQMAQQGGILAKLMTPEAFYGWQAEAAVAMGASKEGTAAGSLGAQFIGGSMTQRVAEELKKMGLLDKFEVARGGHIIANTATVKNADGFAKNPYQWINDTLVPTLEAKGLHGRELLAELARLLGRQTTQRLVGEVAQNPGQFERTVKIFDQAASIGKATEELSQNDLSTNLAGLTGAWKGLMEALGEPGIPVVIGILKGMTGALHDMSAMAAAHPEVVKVLVGAAAGLAAAFVVLGTAAVVGAMAAFIPGGAVAVAIAAVIGGVAGIAAVFSSVDWKGLWEGFLRPIHWLRDFLTSSPFPKTNDDFKPQQKSDGGFPVPGAFNGSDIHRQSYAPPAGGNGGAVQLRGDVNLDGRRVGSIVAAGLADGMSRPGAGMSTPDFRATPYGASI